MDASTIQRLLHLTGAIAVSTALGAVALHGALGGSRAENRWRGLVGALHGVGLVLVVITGVGMLHAYGLDPGGWLWAKVVLWLLLGAAILLPYRAPRAAVSLLVAIPVAGLLAAYLAIARPF